ncbi:protein FAM177A1 [Drosophila suzukii]|uniref:Protein FAM177A1 n=1 Tax=Drosophila suzukii TaxID=28584 RepID=A0AB39YWT7_DROSZ
MSGDNVDVNKSRGGSGLGTGSGSGASASETDNVTALELQSNKRMLYFSDGVMEELSSGSEDEADAEVGDKCYEVHLNENEMALGPRLRYKASRMGNRFLAGIDYVGGGLASLLGITSSKYASEMENYQRAKENGDEDLDNWQPQANNNNNNSNRNETIVLCGPTRSEATLPPTRQ